MTPRRLKIWAIEIKNFLTKLEEEKILLAFIAALTALNLIYRMELARVIYFGKSDMEILRPAAVPVAAFLKTSLNDLILTALLGVCYLAFKLWLRFRLAWLLRWRLFPYVEGVCAGCVLAFIALIMHIHFQLLTQLETGLTLGFLQLSPQMFSKIDFIRMLTPSDWLFLATPLAFFIPLLMCVKFARIYKLTGIILTSLIFASQLLPSKIALPSKISEQPVVYLLNDAMLDEIHKIANDENYYEARQDLPGKTQMDSIHFVDAAFVNTNENFSAPAPQFALAPDGKPWNILIFVLESTGSDYIFDTSQGNEIPMPFLKKVSSEGLYLSNHFSAANISSRAAFSIFTGLYPSPDRGSVGTEKDLSIPTLNRYLGSGYDYFFVHPTTPSYWFPQFLFRNNQLKELYSMDNMPSGTHSDLTDVARNEIDCFDFLQSRLDRAQNPFLAVYWSFVPHYPYSDYGPDFRIKSDLSNKRDRYYNNLRLLDNQIQRVCDHLLVNKVADHTLFVFIGDHGEAFGQHPQVWGHAFGTYSEMYRVPVIFWQPKLISPQIIKFPTSHVDIVPTLLDLIGVPYDPSRFQGASVVRGEPNRKYIFTMDGYADQISAISQKMKKVSVGFNVSEVTAFDLAKDPGEKFPLNDYDFSTQIEAILKFRNFQSQMIPNYNKALLASSIYPPKNSSNPVVKN